ncbi:MAG TPA: cytidine deaminase [Acidimicrobiia bacterium]|nr:cytidine deaminase [Acidimicrobiia bacterium]
MNRDELVGAARAAAELSYSPYSHFRVGAAVVADSGEVFTGANVENAAYPSSNCGEATAIHTAVAAGVRKIDKLAVACIDASDVQGAYPCGRCRQIMSEFGVDTVFVAAGEGSEIRAHTLDELLPHRFTF